MSYYWYVTHFIRKNYFSLHKQYSAKSVVFLFKDYDDLKNIQITDQNEITATVHSVENGLFENVTDYDPYTHRRIYFPLESEYNDLLQNYRKKTNDLTFENPNIFDFNLDIYFERNIEIFPYPEIDIAIIERIDEYISKKEKIISNFQSRKKEQSQLRTESKELLANFNTNSYDVQEKLEYFKERIRSFEEPDLNNLILTSLLSKLFLRGSDRVLDYLRRNPFSIFPNIGNDLGTHFDYKEKISKEFMNFIIYLYTEKKVSTLDTFIERMVFYNPDRRKDIKKILYDEKINLLQLYYGCMFCAIENDLPQSLKDKVLLTLNTLEKIDVSKLPSNEIKKLTNILDVRIEKYRQELRKVKIEFIDPRPTIKGYREFLFSNESLEKKMKDIVTRFTEEEFLNPITDFFKAILSDNSLNYKQKDLIYNFLYQYDFKNMKELESIIKDQMRSDINFNAQILKKIHFSNEELFNFLDHPSVDIQIYITRSLGVKDDELEDIFSSIMKFLKKIDPIILVKGIPYHMGRIGSDFRLLDKIVNFDRNRIIQINENKSIIKVTKDEFMQLMTRENEFDLERYGENLMERTDDGEQFLLINERMSDSEMEIIKDFKYTMNSKLQLLIKKKDN